MIMEKQNKINKSKKKEKEVSARVVSREKMKGLCRLGRENRKDERIRKDIREYIWENSFGICEK